MWSLFSSLFLVVYVIMIIYIGRRGWTILGSRTSGLARGAYVLLFICFILAYPLIEFGSDLLPGQSNIMASSFGWYAMLAVVYFFLLLLTIDGLRFLIKRKNMIPESIRDSIKTPIIVVICMFLAVSMILILGTKNAENPVVTKYNLSINKKAADLKQLKIAMISDIHFGTNIDLTGVDRITEITAEIQPDLILLAGDIIEGVPSPAVAEKLQFILKKMDAKYGIFAVAGNHDRWLRNKDGVDFFQESGIQVLREELVLVNESFYIIGRDDPRSYRDQGRKPIDAYMREVDQSLPVILLDHQPLELEKAQNEKVDLQVAGHTHKGQVFPASLVTAAIYELDYGLLQKDNYHLIVSSGYGTWGPPLRIGNRPEVVEITFNFLD